MMFVDADAVETELIGKLQFVQITVVQRVAELWIVKASWDKSPRRFCATEKNRPARYAHGIK